MVMRLVGFVAIASLVAAPASAAISIDYALYSLGDYTEKGGSDIARGVAVAGDAKINSAAIGTGLNASSKGSAVVVVGGTVRYDNAALTYGDVVFGGANKSGKYTQAKTPGGSFVQGNPVDFDRINAGLLGISAAYGALAPTGTLSNQWGTGTLTGSARAGTDVFTLSTKDLGGFHALRMVGTVGSKAIINIVGDSFSSHFSFDRGHYAAQDVTFNFVDASRIGLNGLNLSGSILAPLATISQQGGRIDGKIIAGAYSGAGATIGGDGGLAVANGDTAGIIPEPGTWAMLIAGFGLVGGMMRRNRRLGAAV